MCRFQLRCVMRQPLTVYPGAEVYATMRLEAHARQSYDIHATLGIKSIDPQGVDQQVLVGLSNVMSAPQEHFCMTGHTMLCTWCYLFQSWASQATCLPCAGERKV